ncbi:MAG: hypothetical protein DMD54_07395 [Gemmatimonadetes bacterium]|nr:MAG: hypothetical protein DMD54_07395 [Gemmatimonadota bacterium]
MLAGIVMVITTVAHPLGAQDTTHKDSVPVIPIAAPAPPPPVPPQSPVPPAAPAPTLEQTRYMEGLKTATRGIAQLRDGLNRVTRTQQADSVTRLHAARRLGGLCTSARSFILSGRPKMAPAAYTDSLRILAKQLTTRLDSLNAALPACEKGAGRDSTTATGLTKKLAAYDDALLAFKNAQAALNKPDSTKTVSQQ